MTVPGFQLISNTALRMTLEIRFAAACNGRNENLRD
jgi:hypothetical protein